MGGGGTCVAGEEVYWIKSINQETVFCWSRYCNPHQSHHHLPPPFRLVATLNSSVKHDFHFLYPQSTTAWICIWWQKYRAQWFWGRTALVKCTVWKKCSSECCAWWAVPHDQATKWRSYETAQWNEAAMSVMVRVKLYLCLTKHRVVKTYWGVEVDFHALLTSTQDVDKWSASRHGRFTSGNRASVTHLIGGCMGPRVGLDAVARRKNYFPFRESSPFRPALSSVTVLSRFKFLWYDWRFSHRRYVLIVNINNFYTEYVSTFFYPLSWGKAAGAWIWALTSI